MSSLYLNDVLFFYFAFWLLNRKKTNIYISIRSIQKVRKTLHIIIIVIMKLGV